MINPQLLDYIRREITKGKSKQDIGNDLIHGGGWLQEDVDEAFREIEPANVVPQAPVAPTPVPNPEPVAQMPVHVEPEIQLPPQPPVGLPAEPVAVHTPEPVHVAPTVMPEPIVVPPPLPVQPEPMHVEPQPIVSPPQPIPVPQPPHPQSAVQQATMELLHEKKRPYILWGLLLSLLSVIVFIAFIFLFDAKFLVPILLLVGANAGVIIFIALIFVIIFSLITSLMLHFATKLFRSVSSSWPKAVFATGLIVLMGAVSTIIIAAAHAGVAFITLLTLLMWGGQVTILVEIYHIRPLKALAVGIVQALLSLVVAGIIGLLVGSLLSSHSTPSGNSGVTQTQQMQMQMIPAEQ